MLGAIRRLNPTLMTLMLFWGANFIAIKTMLVQLTPMTTALVRGVVMGLVLYAVCRLQGRKLEYPRGQSARIHLQGAINMGLYMTLFMFGMNFSTAAEAAIIMNVSPIFTLLMALIARQEPFKWSILGGTLIGFGGVAMVILSSPNAKIGTTGFMGMVFLIGASMTWAFGTLVSKPLLGTMDPIALTTLAMPAGVLFLLPFGAGEVAATPWLNLTLSTWLAFGYFTFVAGALGFFLFYKGVSEVGAAGTMLYQYFVSPIAAISAYLAFQQTLSPWQIIGLAIIIGGVAFANRARLHPQVVAPTD